MREALRGKTREWACGSEELATFLRDGVTITYRYKGKNGIVIGDITVSQADC